MARYQRNQPQPGSSIMQRTGETLTPLGQATHVLQHPVRRWALQQMRKRGQITNRDIKREFPYMQAPSNLPNAMRPLLRFGICNVAERSRGTSDTNTYTLADISALRELRDYLNTVLEENHDQP